MKIYEVYVDVSYLDPDGNEMCCRENGKFFKYRPVAIEYMHKMAEDKNENTSLCESYESEYYGLPRHDDLSATYFCANDFVETDMDWDMLRLAKQSGKISDEEYSVYAGVLRKNNMAKFAKQINACEIALTYYGNMWVVREIEVI